MKPLNVLEMPLDKVALIEASAGTGKTYTMANLYLRLLLGVGCTPMTVEQILVVTFTKAATAELRDRIRANIQQCHAYFKAQQTEPSTPLDSQSQYYFDLFQATKADYAAAILRLRIAEREMDLASVYTIHAFCQKMLTQFAFESGMRFDFELHTDESELLRKLSQSVWRTQFYSCDLVEAKAVSKHLSDPATALDLVRAHIYQQKLPDLPQAIAEGVKDWQSGNFSKQNQAYLDFLEEVKTYWRENETALTEAIIADLSASARQLNANKYKENPTLERIALLAWWSKNSLDSSFPTDALLRFSTDYISGAIKKGCEFELNAHFAKIQDFLTAYQEEFEAAQSQQSEVLQYIFLTDLRSKLAEYKATHSEKGFNDLLTLLNQALQSPQGAHLATHIRRQFSFAMIDEFQDTDVTQYEIFSKIFIQQPEAGQGFIIIGDPKQSIYKFRGADIFTYLKASNQAEEKRTLGVNWRSLRPIVSAVNSLFTFSKESNAAPFFYEGISFQPVLAKTERLEAIENGEQDAELCGQSHFNVYLQPNQELEEKKGKQELKITAPKNDLLAAQCAHQIQQQLKLMQAGEFGLNLANPEKARVFAAKDIAVLVRSRKEANLIKQALAECQIKSVFMSERSNVYEADIAQDLCWVLKACLSPYDQRALLAALGTTLWHFSASELLEIKHNEMKWDAYVERFVHYQQVWAQEGVLPMLHQLYLNEGIIARLGTLTDADRVVTDLLHLTELLQSAQQNCENETALLRWYEHQINEETSEEQADYALRLESEEALIKILTIHSSKGLQYPIVWLPFVGNSKYIARNKGLVLYQDDNAEIHWGDKEKASEIAELQNKAEYSEDLRLLYVALTRAESQLNLVLPEVMPKCWNALLYLLTEGEIGLRSDQQINTPMEQLLKQKIEHCCTKMLPETAPVDAWVSKQERLPHPTPRYFNGSLKQDGQTTSFTALHYYHQAQAENQPVSMFIRAEDDDSQIVTNEIADVDVEELTDNAYSPYQFPHSAKVGTLLHHFFEAQDFQQPIASENVEKLLSSLDLSQEWQAPTEQWFNQIMTTPFGKEALTLNAIQPNACLKEWEFYLRLKNKQGLRKLNQLLKQHHPLAQRLGDLQLPQLEGYVRGFVDCIAKVNGKFYLIDYKSNFLGFLAQDYSAERIEKTMGQYRYDLQYLLYTLALHRYLRTRLGEQYDYERDIGGVAYLFLRGMNGKPNSGVYFDKPSMALIEEMDQLFG